MRVFGLLPSLLFVMATSAVAGVSAERQTPPASQAGFEVDVTEANGIYTVNARFTVARPTTAALAVLTDYERLPRFMPDLRSSKVVARSGSRVTVAQEGVARFLAFSKRISLVLDVDESASMLAFKDTLHKSFSHYEGTWRLIPGDAHTQVVYTLVAKPNFSVPEFLLTKLLKRDAAKMIAALQKQMGSDPSL